MLAQMEIAAAFSGVQLRDVDVRWHADMHSPAASSSTPVGSIRPTLTEHEQAFNVSRDSIQKVVYQLKASPECLLLGGASLSGLRESSKAAVSPGACA